jgi:hypothetical protein
LFRRCGFFRPRSPAATRPDAVVLHVPRQQFPPAARDGIRIEAQQSCQQRIAAVTVFETLQPREQSALLLIEQTVGVLPAELLDSHRTASMTAGRRSGRSGADVSVR